MAFRNGKIIASLTDLKRPLQERVGDFLQLVLDSFRGRQALLIVPTETSEWRILSLGMEGTLKVSKKKPRTGDLRSIFRNHPIINSEGKIDAGNREFSTLFSNGTFSAVPLIGSGKKIAAAVGITWKSDGKIGKIELKKFAGLTGWDTALVLAAVLTTENLAVKNRRLVKLGNIKADHYQMIAHDLKGPISEILSNLDLLKYSPHLSVDDREVLDTALCGCNSLYRMVADLLDINKMEEQKISFCFDTFDLRELIDEKTDKVRVLAAQKGLSMVVTHDPVLPLVKADKEIMERVLANLFSNAIAYSYPNRPVTIQTTTLKEERVVRISVKDEGEGIPKSKQKKIFERFGQSYKRGTRKRYSTGLGLTFCEMAVRNHGGKIWVESEEGKGSVFHFTLPIGPSR